jgi:hypothetical protein
METRAYVGLPVLFSFFDLQKLGWSKRRVFWLSLLFWHVYELRHYAFNL